MFAAVVVLWQLGDHDDREQRALQLVGWSFLVLAAYVGVEAGLALARGDGSRESVVGIVLAGVSLIVMPVLGLAKRRIGRNAGSAPLVAESSETLLCAGLSAALLAGLVASGVLGWWWADPVAALVIAAAAVHEGRYALRGESCCDVGETSTGASAVEARQRR